MNNLGFHTLSKPASFPSMGMGIAVIAFVASLASVVAASVWQPTGMTKDAIIAFAERGDTLYGGTHFGGLQWSPDAGKTWQISPDCEDVGGASVPAVHAYDGHLAAAYEGKGVCLSRNGGTTWESAHEGLPFQPFIRDFESLGPWLLAGLQKSSGGAVLYRRAWKAGEIWQASGSGFDTSVQGVEKLARDGQGRIYAAVSRRKGDGNWLYASSDTGRTWNPVDSLVAGPIYDLIATDGYLIAATQVGVYRSPDAGATWEDCGPEFDSTPVYALSTRPGLLLAGGSNKVYRSYDNGGSWSWMPDGLPTGDVSVLAVWAGKHSILASIAPLKGVFQFVTTAGIPRVNRHRPSPIQTRPIFPWDALGRFRSRPVMD